ncbi:major facilitator superfamily transporter [Diaporthe helianthi]|uniref:Major facilitator superfamily transporter n=1 Tax=Diaporthe helianthi TaxID=158607 RepID=A0A2P5HVM2_DIAHE|nr:major facilitator superfamily transporter [Diaporthe helianthi]
MEHSTSSVAANSATEDGKGLEQGPADSQPDSVTPTTGPESPPDGGLGAWLHVLAGFMLLLNSWGIVNTYGVFQSYYESGVLFTATSSQISWIGSAQAFFIMFCGIVTGPLYDRGYVRVLLFTGACLIVGGHVALSFCSTYWQVLLAQGICAGIGEGCLFVPTISILPAYFKARLGLVVGIANAGASLGGVIFPLMLSKLLYHVGFAWAVRAMALISLTTLTSAICIVRMPFKPQTLRRPLDLTAFSDWPFMALVFATLLAMMGVVALQFYIAYFAEYFNIFDTEGSIALVAIYNAASFIGRILPNYLSDKIGVFNLISPAPIINGTVILCMIVVRTKAAMVAIAGPASGLSPLVF